MTEFEKELSIKVKRLEDDCKAYNFTQHELQEKNKELEAKIEKMKSDVMRNVKWADQNKNGQMYCKLNAMINQWEIKENDRRRIF